MECKDGTKAEWDITNWGLININANGAKKISCNIDFGYEGTLVDYVKMMANYSDEIVEDDYGNLRYIGKNPNNYVLFNNELWRIIGVMKDIENADGSKEDKVKLIRSKSIGKYSLDINNNVDWSTCDLQKILNEGAYYNRTSGDCPSGVSGETKACDFSSTGLTEEAKGMTSESVWNLGGSSTYDDVIAKTFYERERGTDVYSGRSITWIGKVGLMYPSDYGYATSGGATTDRNTCLNTVLYKWSGVSDCKNNDWLYKSSSFQMTITPNSRGGVSIGFYVSSTGYVYDRYPQDFPAIYPSVYLGSSIGIESGGVGTSDSPFVLK